MSTRGILAGIMSMCILWDLRSAGAGQDPCVGGGYRKILTWVEDE